MKQSKEILQESLVNKVAKRCMHLLQGTNFKAWIQFWQTWANLEAIPFIATSKHFTKDVQTQASQKGSTDWLKFQMSSKGIPSVYKSIPGFFKNNNFWDPTNKAITWEDRLWLGNSYLFLYNVFRVETYLLVAVELYKFILQGCGDWRAEGYKGLECKSGTGRLSSIVNELFLVFSCRLYHITRETQYLDAANMQYKVLFMQNGKYINSNTINIIPQTQVSDVFYTHTQGIILQGLAYLLIYGDNYQQYMSQLIRITSGTIQYFRNTDQHKLIMKQFVKGSQQALRTAAIYRSFFFRHLLHLFYTLPAKTFQDFTRRTPFLRTFVLDNAQAMCKYQNLSPCYNWEKFNDSIIHDYNAFNMFYVLLSAIEIYNINEIVVNGVMVPSDGTLSVKLGPNIRGVYISTFNFDSQGVYRRGERKLVPSGIISFVDLLRGELLVARDNNRNIMQLTVLTVNNQQVSLVLCHIEGEGSMFGIIPDYSGEQIINSCIVRIKAKRFREGLIYNTKSNLFQVLLGVASKNQLSSLVITVT